MTDAPARIALTGTPGTGKTTVADRLTGPFEVVHLGDLVRAEGLWSERDPDRGSLVVDLDAVADRLAAREPDGPVLVESHLAHRLDADRVVVLRCRPDRLRERLAGRDEPPATVAENAESEALDVILAEAVERHGRDAVHEIDTTDRGPAAVADAVARAARGETTPGVGRVDFTDHLDP
jgi:adenylate kinase